MTEPAPRRALSLGAGVQSTTLFLMALAGEVEPFDVAVFADTGAEPRAVYEHLIKLVDEGRRGGLPVVVVAAGEDPTDTDGEGFVEGLGARALLTERMLDPTRRDGIQIPVFIRGTGGQRDGMLRRQCTERFKSRPVYKFLNAWREGAPVVQALGISWDEVGRMKPAQRKWVTNEYPLIEGRHDRRWCHARLAAFGWSAPRSACVYCPYHSDAEWRHLRDNAPEDFAEAIRVDHEMRAVHAERMASGATSLTGTPFVHRSLLPLDEVDFRTEEDRGQGSLFGEECEGLCGI